MLARPNLGSVAWTLAAASLGLALVIANLAVTHWITCCFWEFGVLHADNVPRAPVYDRPSTVQDVRQDVCEESQYQEAVERLCPEFCSTLTRIQVSGILMLALGLLVIALEVGVLGLGLAQLTGRSVSPKLVQVLASLPAGLYTVSYGLYFAIQNPFSIPPSKRLHGMAESRYDLGPGVILAAFVCVVLISQAVVAACVARRPTLATHPIKSYELI